MEAWGHPSFWELSDGSTNTPPTTISPTQFLPTSKSCSQDLPENFNHIFQWQPQHASREIRLQQRHVLAHQGRGKEIWPNRSVLAILPDRNKKFMLIIFRLECKSTRTLDSTPRTLDRPGRNGKTRRNNCWIKWNLARNIDLSFSWNMNTFRALEKKYGCRLWWQWNHGG